MPLELEDVARMAHLARIHMPVCRNGVQCHGSKRGREGGVDTHRVDLIRSRRDREYSANARIMTRETQLARERVEERSLALVDFEVGPQKRRRESQEREFVLLGQFHGAGVAPLVPRASILFLRELPM